jgi:hypothetical protein
MIRAVFIFALISLAPIASADEVESAMNQEIDNLLEAVESSDCIFVRNGSEHEGAAAKDHLSLKRRRGKKYFSTADEFIDRLASSSSWSGKPYHIRCGEETHLAKDWFMVVLTKFRETEKQ